jgi:hypothetical protein
LTSLNGSSPSLAKEQSILLESSIRRTRIRLVLSTRHVTVTYVEFVTSYHLLLTKNHRAHAIKFHAYSMNKDNPSSGTGVIESWATSLSVAGSSGSENKVSDYQLPPLQLWDDIAAAVLLSLTGSHMVGLRDRGRSHRGPNSG